MSLGSPLPPATCPPPGPHDFFSTGLQPQAYLPLFSTFSGSRRPTWPASHALMVWFAFPLDAAVQAKGRRVGASVPSAFSPPYGLPRRCCVDSCLTSPAHILRFCLYGSPRFPSLHCLTPHRGVPSLGLVCMFAGHVPLSHLHAPPFA